MSYLTKLFSILGCVNMAFCVLLGAFGAHALKTKIPEEYLIIFKTGIQYHFYHALGLFIVAFVAYFYPSGSVKLAGGLMVLGIILFSGSLYGLALSQIRWLGVLTPLGGLCFIAAWILLTVVLIKGI